MLRKFHSYINPLPDALVCIFHNWLSAYGRFFLLGPQNRCLSAYGRCPFMEGCWYRVSLKKWPGPQTGVHLQEVSTSGSSTVQYLHYMSTLICTLIKYLYTVPAFDSFKFKYQYALWPIWSARHCDWNSSQPWKIVNWHTTCDRYHFSALQFAILGTPAVPSILYAYFLIWSNKFYSYFCTVPVAPWQH